MSIRVIITDDHPVVRDGLRFAITRGGGDIAVVGEAGDGQALLELARTTPADVYVTDVTMPVLNGIEATRALVRRDPSARVIMLSLHGSDSIVSASLRAGARGFMTKESLTRCVAEAIREVHRGCFYLSPDVAHCVVKPFLDGRAAPPAALTPREARVLQLVAEGRTSKEIAVQLDLSVNTIQKHRANLMAKLDIHDPVGLARYAIREGIAKP